MLDRWGIGIKGHLEQGVTTNSRNPTNPAAGVGNFPATQMNYRNDEYMLNSLYLTLERKTDTGGSGWDIGGHLDLIYGTTTSFCSRADWRPIATSAITGTAAGDQVSEASD